MEVAVFARSMKPCLLVIELWGLGDLVIATPFLRAAAEQFEVTLLAKPFACELQARFWPGVRVKPFTAPWTALRGKYRLWRWPWPELGRLRRWARAEQFALGGSSRWDPRDHALLFFLGVPERLGFPRLGSQRLLTRPLVPPEPGTHRFMQWRVLGQALGLNLPDRPAPYEPRAPRAVDLVIHTGAARPFCIWPLENYRELVRRFRQRGYSVRVLCDPFQRTDWERLGEREVGCPESITELIAAFDQATAFLGNDSGPAHLAALCGLPVYVLFGPHLPEVWAPFHAGAEWLRGRPCPFKPCDDTCRFGVHHCLTGITVDQAFAAAEVFVRRHCGDR